jgi:hypothetical protein
MGGLGIGKPDSNVFDPFKASKTITAPLVKLIISQDAITQPDDSRISDAKANLK